MNSTYHTTYQYHFCLGENLLRGDGAQSCLSVCHQSSLSSPLSSPLLYWLRHQCWQIIQSGDDAAFRQNVIFPNNCANKPSLSALSCSLQPDPSNQVMWLTSPTIYRHVSVRIIFRKSAVYTRSAWCASILELLTPLQAAVRLRSRHSTSEPILVQISVIVFILYVFTDIIKRNETHRE